MLVSQYCGFESSRVQQLVLAGTLFLRETVTIGKRENVSGLAKNRRKSTSTKNFKLGMLDYVHDKNEGMHRAGEKGRYL